MPIEPGNCHIWSTDGELDLHCQLWHMTPPKITSGGGGWTTVSIPRRPPMTVWQGGTGLRIELSLLLRASSHGSADAKMWTLEQMAGSAASDREPPTLYWNANGPHDHDKAPGAMWVIEDPPEYSEFAYVGGVLAWQVATITLLQYQTTTLTRLKKSDPFRRVSMRKGESLRMFAKRVLRDASRWRDIKSLNRDDPRCPTSADYKLKKAHTLKVPPLEPRKAKGR